jgi:hypothetical protein
MMLIWGLKICKLFTDCSHCKCDGPVDKGPGDRFRGLREGGFAKSGICLQLIQFSD